MCCSAIPLPKLCDTGNKIINKGSIENGCCVRQIFSPNLAGYINTKIAPQCQENCVNDTPFINLTNRAQNDNTMPILLCACRKKEFLNIRCLQSKEKLRTRQYLADRKQRIFITLQCEYSSGSS
jgi:hypothetical protein